MRYVWDSGLAPSRAVCSSEKTGISAGPQGGEVGTGPLGGCGFGTAALCSLGSFKGPLDNFPEPRAQGGLHDPYSKVPCSDLIVTFFLQGAAVSEMRENRGG